MTSVDPTTPAAIASRLTERQRAALMWLPGDGSERTEEKTPYLKSSLWHLRSRNISQDIAATLAMYRQEARMLNGNWLPSHWRLTPLGRRVRAVVEAGDGT